MNVVIHRPAARPTYREVDADRRAFQEAFCDRMCAGKSSLGAVLDVGCGPATPAFLARVAELATSYDGLDPGDGVTTHPGLRHRYHSTLEAADLPPRAYDTLFAYNVVEHVERARPFFAKVADALRPGGEFWALTPSARHPFAAIGTAVRVANLKRLYVAHVHAESNDYPAYYRLNTPRAVTRALDTARFRSAEFWHLPSTQWDRYFPAPLRALPHAYDRLVGTRFDAASLLLMFKLTAA